MRKTLADIWAAAISGRLAKMSAEAANARRLI
jgi:hypothetical protein